MSLEDVAAERATLAGMVQSSDVYLDVAPILSSRTYTDDLHQPLFSIVKDIYEEDNTAKMDLALIRAKASDMKLSHLIENKQTLQYINGLFTYGVQPTNVLKFAGKIRKLEVARLLRGELNEAVSDVSNVSGNESVDQLIGLVENRIFDFTSLIAETKQSGYSHISEDSLEYYQHLKDNPRDLIGISTGYPLYDQYLGGGLRRQAVNVVGARTGCGKSFYGMNVGVHVATKLNIPVLYLDTEMSKNEHCHRLWGRLSGVQTRSIENGKCGQSEIDDKKVIEAIKIANNSPYFHATIAGQPFEETLAYIRRWLIREVGVDENGKTNDCLVIYDYLKLMTSEGLSNDMKEYQMLGFQTTGLTNFAIRNDIPILSFVQLNKDGITQEGLQSISQSDRISWFASSVSIYKKKSDEEMVDSGKAGNRKLIVLKSRHGMENEYGQYINMKFDGSVALIEEKELCTGGPEKPKCTASGKDNKFVVKRKKKENIDDDGPKKFD